MHAISAEALYSRVIGVFVASRFSMWIHNSIALAAGNWLKVFEQWLIGSVFDRLGHMSGTDVLGVRPPGIFHFLRAWYCVASPGMSLCQAHSKMSAFDLGGNCCWHGSEVRAFLLR